MTENHLTEIKSYKCEDNGKSYFLKMGITNSCLNSKTSHCRHENGCLENILHDSLKCFILGYSAKTGINILLYLAKMARKGLKLSEIWALATSKDNMRLPLFIFSLTLILKSGICVLRRLRQCEDWKNPAIAGALAGYFSLFFLQAKGKRFLSPFALSRAFDCFYNSLVKRKVIPESKWNYFILYSMMISFVVFFYSSTNGIAPPSITKFFDFVFMAKVDWTSEYIKGVRTRDQIESFIIPH